LLLNASRKRLPCLATVCLFFGAQATTYQYSPLRVVTSSTEGINKLIFNGLSTIRGKLVNEAEQVLSSLDIYPPNDSTLSDEERIVYIQQRADLLLDDKNPSHYVLHGYDPERGKILVYSAPPYLDLHEDFWFGRNSPFIDPQARSLISQISWFMYTLTGTVVSK
jgi:hypothetical protein